MFNAMKRALVRAVAPLGGAVRRWEAAENNRLNAAHWRKATDTPINADLRSDLNALRIRATYESRRNPTIEGVIDTYGKDVSGREGPMLLVICDDPEYAKALQDLWWDWFQSPDAAGRMGGVDYLRLWVRRLFDSGEFVAQVVSETDPRAMADASEGLRGVSMRLKSIHPRRVGTPTERLGDPDVFMGVRLTKAGRAAEYFIAESPTWGTFTSTMTSSGGSMGGFIFGQFKTVPAADIIHEFIVVEDDQARGVPWLAVSLESVGELRDFDAQVLDAARQAANQAVFWYTDNPAVEPIDVNEISNVERGQQQTGPPGWKPQMLLPTQPQTNYVEYRTERQRDIGRPIGMPAMMVRLGSEEHNFSSARFDGEIYKRGISCTREWLERRTLGRLVGQVRREGELFAAANPTWQYAALRRRPKVVEYLWIWPPLAHVDPEKQAAEEESRLESGTLSFDEACAAAGKNPDTQIKKLSEIVKKFADAKLPPPPWMTAGLQKIGVKLAPDGSIVPIAGLAPAPGDSSPPPAKKK